MHKLKPGWTKARMLEVLLTRNNGTKAWDASNTTCCYLSPDGNACAVGCFIPQGHPGQQHKGIVHNLIEDYPDLEEMLPMSISSMRSLQLVHDGHSSLSSGSLQDRFRRFVEEQVEEC